MEDLALILGQNSHQNRELRGAKLLKLRAGLIPTYNLLMGCDVSSFRKPFVDGHAVQSDYMKISQLYIHTVAGGECEQMGKLADDGPGDFIAMVE